MLLNINIGEITKRTRVKRNVRSQCRNNNYYEIYKVVTVHFVFGVQIIQPHSLTVGQAETEYLSLLDGGEFNGNHESVS